MTPRTPFISSPHFVGAGLHSWITDPPGQYNLVVAEKFDEAAATAITEEVDSLMRKRWPTGPYIYVHDFTRIDDFKSDARQIITRYGETTPRAEIKQIVVVMATLAQLIRESARASIMRLQAKGVPIKGSTDPQETILKYVIRPVSDVLPSNTYRLTKPILKVVRS